MVEFDGANDCRAASVGRFDGREVISVYEIYEGSPFFFGKAGEFGVASKVYFVNIRAAFFDVKVY